MSTSGIIFFSTLAVLLVWGVAISISLGFGRDLFGMRSKMGVFIRQPKNIKSNRLSKHQGASNLQPTNREDSLERATKLLGGSTHK